MAKPNFLNENAGRSFPFLEHFQELLEFSQTAPFAPLAALPNSAVVDFGSMMGVLSYYEEGTHIVYLSRVAREAGAFIFDFMSTAPGLAGQILQFRRPVGTRDYVTEYSDVESLDPAVSASLSDVCPADDSLWEGYLTTGNLRELEEVLPTDGISLVGEDNEVLVEPALTQSLAQRFIRTLNLANGDRTRTTNPAACIQSVLPFQQIPIYINQKCVTGPVRFKAGYNCVVTQGNVDNSITIAAQVAGGEGEPCSEVPLFAGEVPPTDSKLLTGGPACDEVIRSINGIGGRIFDVQGGDGVDVAAIPGENRLEINMNMNNLAACFSEPDPETSQCLEESQSSLLCGEAP